MGLAASISRARERSPSVSAAARVCPASVLPDFTDTEPSATTSLAYARRQLSAAPCAAPASISRGPVFASMSTCLRMNSDICASRTPAPRASPSRAVRRRCRPAGASAPWEIEIDGSTLGLEPTKGGIERGLDELCDEKQAEADLAEGAADRDGQFEHKESGR